MAWYIIKKIKDKRWKAYELDELPELKRGYEAKGPYDNLIYSMIAANGGEELLKRKQQTKAS